MKCQKCGAYVYNSDKFCRSCGTTLTADNCKYGDNIENSKYDSSSCHTKQYEYSYKYSNNNKDTNTKYTNNYEYDDRFSIDPNKYNYVNLNDSGGEDKYIKAYVGPNYEHVKRDAISIPTIVFGPLYFLYRKLYKQGIIFLILTIIPDLFLESSLATIISIGIRIFYTLKFKDMYFKHVEEKVENIKQENLDKTTTELLNICKKKGGTSFKFIKGIIAIAVITIILFIIIGIIINNDISTSYKEDTYQYMTNENYSMKYILPTDFEILQDQDNFKKYIYDETHCYVTFKSTTTDLTAEEYLNTNILPYSNEQTTPVENIMFYEIWQYKKITSSTRTEKFYAHKRGSQLYLVETLNFRSNPQSEPICTEKFNELLNTIEIEKNY